jgi:hypothetical protein
LQKDTQQNLFNQNNDIDLIDVFRAYFDCRKNKRNKLDALEFEIDFEKEIIKLWEEINENKYKVKPLDVFIVDSPVKREIFAADFRDRIVHHLILNKINFIFEKEFIYDSYSCRKNKGTHFGVRRIKKFIRQCSKNYKRDCYILKMDIKGYFMHINKNILLEKLVKIINEKYFEKDKEKIIYLCEIIINNDSVSNCVRKSPREKWKGLPSSKSLFYAPENCGLPIGNYTNQVFANFYLNSLDHFIKSVLKIRYYGRYVDDFLLISKDKEKLKKIIPIVREFLKNELKLTLHPQKIYFQHYFKGVSFLGYFIKPWRSYLSKRTKNNFWKTTKIINRKIEEEKFSKKDKEKTINQINSFLGATKHCNGYNLRKKFLSKINNKFWLYFKAGKALEKIILIGNKKVEVTKKKKRRKSKIDIINEKLSCLANK